MRPLSHWIGDLYRSRGFGNLVLRCTRVGEVGYLQLANLEEGGVFYRCAKSAVEWMFACCPGRYYRLAGYINWLVNKRLVQGPGAFLPHFWWRALTVEFRDLGDEELSMGYLARGLVEQAFLIKYRYTGEEHSDEKLLRLGRLAYRDGARFLEKLEGEYPELARRVGEIYPEFDSEVFLKKQRMPFSQKVRYVPKRKRAGELPGASG